jgi:purine-binding chemotaxis protein CheW
MSAPLQNLGKNKTFIDWSEVHQRLKSAHVAFDNVLSPDSKEAERILHERATKLAKEAITVVSDDSINVVEFTLADERYALETCYVREVHPLVNLAEMPCAQKFVVGIINLRGEILSVIDLKKFFDLPENGLTDLNKVIVLHYGLMLFGILADSIVGVRSILKDVIQPTLPTLTGIRERYLKGVTSDRTVVLDGIKLLTDEAIIVNEKV